MGICGSSVVHQDGATTLRRGPDQTRRKRDARELRRLPAASPTLPHARSFLRLRGHLRPGGGQGLRQGEWLGLGGREGPVGRRIGREIAGQWPTGWDWEGLG